MKLIYIPLFAALGLAPAYASVAQTQLASGPAALTLPSAQNVQAVHSYVESLANDPDEARAMKGFDALTAAGEAYAPALSEIYLNPKGDVRCRWVAGQALGRLRSQPAREAIRQGLTDSLPLARIAAIEALPKQDPAGARAPIEAALNDPAAVVRAAAADALARLGDPRAATSLMAAYAQPANEHKGRSLFVRVNILTALGALRARDAVPVMLTGLEDSNAEVAEAARKALLQLSHLPAPPPGTSPEADRWRAWFGL